MNNKKQTSFECLFPMIAGIPDLLNIERLEDLPAQLGTAERPCQ